MFTMASPGLTAAATPQCEAEPELSPANGSAVIDYDLAIVGGGIVGTTLACALKDSGLKVALIEAQSDSAAIARGQAYALHLSSQRIFQGIGIWEAIAPQLEMFKQVRLSDADFPQVVQFQPQDLQAEALGYVAEHRVLLQALRDFLRQCSHVTWFCPVRVSHTVYHPTAVELQLTPTEPAMGVPAPIRVRLLVAADGARSQIRQQAGIQTDGWRYWQSCIVATLAPEKPHNNIAYERFWPSGPFAILPLPQNRCRIVWTAPHAEAQAMLALSEAEFLQELSRRYGDQMGKLALVGQPFIFPAQLMHTRRYVGPRLALIGDAAHCCHPVGGQGMNMGIRDAAALAEVLQTGDRQGRDIGELVLLRRYERWRRWENLATLGFTDFLDRMFSNRWWLLLGLRRLGLRLMQTLQPLKCLALRFMAGLSFRTPEIVRRSRG